MAAEQAGAPLATIWASWLVVMTGANLATPLYGVYAKRFGFSSLTLTTIFAVYALTLVPSLVLFGRMSDRFGRLPVMLMGLAAAAAGLLLFATASSTPWLFAARASQGLAVGMISGAATAALVEHDRSDDDRRPALLAGLAQAGGSGLGPLAAGLLAQWAPAPRQLAFLVLLGLTGAAAAALLIFVPSQPGSGESWRVQLPRVPDEIRAAFLRVSLTAATVWASLALTLSIVPSYVSKILDTRNLALLGGLAALGLASSCCSQLTARRLTLSLTRAQAAGLGLLTVGMLCLAAAAPLHALAPLLAAAILIGAGHGLAVLFAQEELNQLAPDERRGEVTAGFVACIYALVGTAVIAAGVLDRSLSLTAAVMGVAISLGTVAALTGAWQLSASGD